MPHGGGVSKSRDRIPLQAPRQTRQSTKKAKTLLADGAVCTDLQLEGWPYAEDPTTERESSLACFLFFDTLRDTVCLKAYRT